MSSFISIAYIHITMYITTITRLQQQGDWCRRGGAIGVQRGLWLGFYMGTSPTPYPIATIVRCFRCPSSRIRSDRDKLGRLLVTMLTPKRYLITERNPSSKVATFKIVEDIPTLPSLPSLSSIKIDASVFPIVLLLFF